MDNIMDRALEFAWIFWSSFFTGIFFTFVAVILPILILLAIIWVGIVLFSRR